MKKLMYLSAASLFLTFTSCEQRGTSEGYDSDNTELNTEDNAAAGGLFATSYEDLMEDKNELQEDVMEMKRDRTTRAGEMTTEYDSLVTSVEQKLQEMEAKAAEFRNATEDQKERLKDQFDLLKTEASERIDYINNTYKSEN